METANVLVALGGDKGNTVVKYGVTAAEIAVLRAIHGDDAISDVDPTGDVVASDREERDRLSDLYGRALDHTGRQIVGAVFPGVGARLTERLADLGLVPEQYKPTARAVPKPRTVRADVLK